MFLKMIKSKGLAHNSYFLSDSGEALVVDPRRDCAVYVKLAQKEYSKIKYVLETHRNEDYVTGSLELRDSTGAEIAHSKETPFKYGEHNLSDGETINIGTLQIKTLYTPGHTNDSICYVIYDSFDNSQPMMMFTGDTLFAGDVGRTDLLGLDAWREQSEKLYNSLHEKVFPLGDHVIFYPAHGSGSICGYEISEKEYSTIGYERRTNPLLQMDKESFIESALKRKLLIPPYFSKMEIFNLQGPPLLGKYPVPKPLNANEFDEERQKPNTVVVDTRDPDAFAGSHIPDSLSIWLDGLSFFPGWVLTYDQRILLVTERLADVEQAEAYLWRLGFDNIVGYLCPSMREWRNLGKPMECLGVLSATKLKERLEQGSIVLVDVREEREWEEGHIEGALNIYVGHLKEEANRLLKDQAVATTCEWGGRGGLGASILKKIGFNNVYNVLGGMRAWKNLGYPTKSSSSYQL